MFIASVSTMLFNANPLLRYDGYYILSDIIEIPNLAQRAKQYIYYLVQQVLPGRSSRPETPPTAAARRPGSSSTASPAPIYRVLICVSILLFIADKLFMFGLILAVAAAVAWLFVPLGKFVHYLFTSGELMRVRGRAIGSTAAVVAAIVVFIGFVPMGDHIRVDGIVEPARQEILYTAVGGFVTDVIPSESNSLVSPEGLPLVTARSFELHSQLNQLLAQQHELEIRRRQAMTKDIAQAQIIAEQIASLDEQKERITHQIDALNIKAPFKGLWISPNIDRARGAYMHRGDPVGMVASKDLVIHAVVNQDTLDMLPEAAREASEMGWTQAPTTAPTTRPANAGIRSLEIRIKGHPDDEMTGRITRIVEAGQDRLPSAALGYAAGGSIRTDPKDPKGVKAAERFFEVFIKPGAVTDKKSSWYKNARGQSPLMPGQRVIVRLEMAPRPLIQQWYRSILQLVQRRFQI